MSDVNDPGGLGISRRSLIKRGAIVGGTVLWAAPVVQSFTSPAGAVEGSPACSCVLIVTIGPNQYSCTLEPNSCACFCCCQFGANCANCNSAQHNNDPCAVPAVFTGCTPL